MDMICRMPHTLSFPAFEKVDVGYTWKCSETSKCSETIEMLKCAIRNSQLEHPPRGCNTLVYCLSVLTHIVGHTWKCVVHFTAM